MRLLPRLILVSLFLLMIASPLSAQRYGDTGRLASDEMQKNNVVGFSIGFASLANFHDDFPLGTGERFGISVDDSISGNLDWSHFFNQKNGYLISVSYAPSSAALFVDSLGGPDGDADLLWVDVAWVYRVLYGDTAVFFQLGIGAVGITYDDDPLTIAGQPPATPEDSESYTAHIGLGARSLFTENWFLEVKSRYHYVNELDTEIGSLRFNHSTGIFEGTIGLAFQF